MLVDATVTSSLDGLQVFYPPALAPGEIYVTTLHALLVSTVKYLSLLLQSYQATSCVGISTSSGSDDFAKYNVWLCQDHPCRTHHQGHFLPHLFWWPREESEAFKMLLMP